VERALASFGWGAGQVGCLERLWDIDQSRGAHGIPQSPFHDKTAAAGGQTNFETQVDWGLGYIESRYGSPCSALNFHLANNWY
jgi:hypothetical protein